MIVETTVAALLVNDFAKAWVADDIDQKNATKNARAFTKMEQANIRAGIAREQLLNKLRINGVRKKAILEHHIKSFAELYGVFRTVSFREGKGIEQISNYQDFLKCASVQISIPYSSTSMTMNDKEILVNFVLRGGVGGIMLQESKAGSKVASKNMAQANAVEAQMETIILAYSGISEKVEIITDLLQKLSALFMKGIQNMRTILDRNGLDSGKYSDEDIAQINATVYLAKLVYRIINVPVIGEDGEIESAAIETINDGQKYIDSIGG